VHVLQWVMIGQIWVFYLKVGLPVAPAQAHPEVLHIARYITQFSGGNGAVREVCDLILKSQNKYHPLLQQAFQ
jgi:3-deoxy-D-manno-octulosonate 8-phosphate phosphatase (KDO 8-P phosphatase)